MSLRLMVLVILGGLPAYLGLIGCARQDAASGELTPQQIKEIEAKKIQSDPFLRTQVDIGLVARRLDGERVEVSVTNKTNRPLLIGPKLFCVVNPPSRDLNYPLEESLRRFPVLKLPPGQQASGELSFPIGILRPGSWLVFNHPNDPAVRPARAEIQ